MSGLSHKEHWPVYHVKWPLHDKHSDRSFNSSVIIQMYYSSFELFSVHRIIICYTEVSSVVSEVNTLAVNEVIFTEIQALTVFQQEDGLD